MKKYGLIGYPLTHSFSRKYFKSKFKKEDINDSFYIHYPLQNIEELGFVLLQNPELVGLNVTIPYKSSVIPFMDILDAVSSEIGAVNTIKILKKDPELLPDYSNPSPLLWRQNLILKGYNTDVTGFEESLICFEGLKSKPGLKALILGTGGASKAVSYVLKKWSIPFSFVSRQTEMENGILYDELTTEFITEHLLIVNTTPKGMFPNTEEKPLIPYNAITSEHYLFDLIYNPEKTLFLKLGEERGAKIMNGLKMLEVQAEEAWKIWNSAKD